MLTKNETNLVIKHLRLWATGDFESIPKRNRVYGLCSNTQYILNFKDPLRSAEFLEWLSNIIVEWEHFSGDRTFPVPTKDVLSTPDEYYYTLTDLWSNNASKNRSKEALENVEAYIEKRLMLCTFIADTLEQQLEIDTKG